MNLQPFSRCCNLDAGRAWQLPYPGFDLLADLRLRKSWEQQ
jgi:hypothetical protein